MMNEIERAIEQIEKEKQCVIRADKCNRDCANCDLLSDAENILNSYDLAIQALQNESNCKSFKDNDKYEDKHLLEVE